MSVNDKIVEDLVKNEVGFVTTVPCKQLAVVIEVVEINNQLQHVPAIHDAEGMGL